MQVQHQIGFLGARCQQSYNKMNKKELKALQDVYLLYLLLASGRARIDLLNTTVEWVRDGKCSELSNWPFPRLFATVRNGLKYRSFGSHQLWHCCLFLGLPNDKYDTNFSLIWVCTYVGFGVTNANVLDAKVSRQPYKVKLLKRVSWFIPGTDKVLNKCQTNDRMN